MGECKFHDKESINYERYLFEIVEQAYVRREKVLVFVQSAERAAAVDRLLWINKQEAFIPHEIAGANPTDPSVPVLIVTQELNPIDAGILVADGHCSVEFASKFKFVHEFVDRGTPALHEACRERFRAYRAKKFAVEYSK